MSKDDPKVRPSVPDEDSAYITMPPELRAYARKLDNKVIRPGDDPLLDAAAAALRVLNGGPDADPLYYDVKKEQAAIRARMGETPGIGNASVYVAPTEVPAAAAVEDVGAPTVVVEGEEAGAGNEKPQDVAPSPWSSETDARSDLRTSALPSSLPPRETETVVDATMRAHSRRERVKATVVVVALVTAALGVGVAVSRIRRGPYPEAAVGAPSATVTPQAASTREPTRPAPRASVEVAAPPSVSATAETTDRATPRVAPPSELHRAAPRAPSAVDDPHRHAGVKPAPAMTVAPIEPAPTVAPIAPSPPATTAPKAPAPPASAEKPIYD